MKLNDIQVNPGEKSSSLDLAKLVGKKILRVEGRVSTEFQDPLVFHVTAIVFEDGTTEFLEGEHDIAYIPSGGTFDDEVLKALYLEANPKTANSEEG